MKTFQNHKLGYSISIIFLAVLLILSACGKEPADYSENIAPPSDSPQYDDWVKAHRPNDEDEFIMEQWDKWNIGNDIELDWFIGMPSHTYLKDWSEYSLLSDVEKITGVSPKVNVPAGDPTERLNIMITMDEWPDLITVGYGDSIINKLIEAGQVYSMDELAELYAPDFVNSELPESLVKDTRYEGDQKLYGLPGGYLLDFLCESKDGVGAYTYSVRKDYYEELGSPSIKNIDDFYNVLKDFKNKYPTLNGKPSVPLCLGTNGTEGITTLRYSFGVFDYYVKDNGETVLPYAFNPRFEDLLLFLNRLNLEGLIDPDALVKAKSVIDQDLATRTFMCPAYFWYLDAANASLATLESPTRFISIDPLNNTGTDKVVFPGLTRLGGQMTLIPRKAKNPQAAFEFLRYMISEDGNMLMMYGREGEHYVYEERDGEQWIKRTEYVREQWTNNYMQFLDETGMFSFVYCFLKPKPEIGMEHPDRMKYDRPIANEYSFDNTILSYNMSPDPVSDAGIAIQRLGDIQSKEIYKIINSPSQEDAKIAFDKFIERLEEIPDLDKASEYLTEQYHKNLDKFVEPRY